MSTGHQTATDAALGALRQAIEAGKQHPVLDAMLATIEAIVAEQRASAPREARKRLTQGDTEALVAKYGPTFGEQDTRDRIDAAVNHVAYEKARDKRRYVDGWLRRDADKVQAGIGHGGVLDARALLARQRARLSLMDDVPA